MTDNTNIDTTPLTPPEPVVAKPAVDEDMGRWERFEFWMMDKLPFTRRFFILLWTTEGGIRGYLRYQKEMLRLNTVARDEKLRKHDKYEDCSYVIRRATEVNYRTDEIRGYNVNDPNDVETHSIRHCVDKVTPELLRQREKENGFTH